MVTEDPARWENPGTIMAPIMTAPMPIAPQMSNGEWLRLATDAVTPTTVRSTATMVISVDAPGCLGHVRRNAGPLLRTVWSTGLCTTFHHG